MGLFATNITLHVQTPIAVGEVERISGTLMWYCPPFLCPPFGGWKPYPEVPVDIYIDGKKYTTVTTDGNGNFQVDVYLSEGIHTIEAEYPGSWKDSPASATETVQVMSLQEYNQYVTNQAIQWGLAGFAAVMVLGLLLKERY